jgi:hypothetical protein
MVREKAHGFFANPIWKWDWGKDKNLSPKNESGGA